MKRKATDLDCHLHEENKSKHVVGNIQKCSLLSTTYKHNISLNRVQIKSYFSTMFLTQHTAGQARSSPLDPFSCLGIIIR